MSFKNIFWIYFIPLIIFLFIGRRSFSQINSSENLIVFYSQEIFPLQYEHVHGPTIVQLSNGDLLAAWFQGSGERWADDVRIMGARLKKGQLQWSPPFLMADTPDFPDINPIMFIDGKKRLWLMWYTVIANQWETSLLKYRISENYLEQKDAPVWAWQDVLLVKPGDSAERGIQSNDRFVTSLQRQIQEYEIYLERQGFFEGDPETVKLKRKTWKSYTERIMSLARGKNMIKKGKIYQPNGSSQSAMLGYPYFRRMGWQTKNKPFIFNNHRIIVPLYSDGFNFSLMAITDDWGQTWQFSNPLFGLGNIQPSIVQKSDGNLVAYMRDNGPPPKRLQMAESSNGGLSWSLVHDSELPNPGSGADAVTLKNGHWVMLYNDTETGRNSLAVAISTDEGKSWIWKRHLEFDAKEDKTTRSHYPAVIQGHDGLIHVVYSYHLNDRNEGPNKTIKYAKFNEKWVQQGDQ